MDTSETFIKQCEKAVEIQNGWKLEQGDWFTYWESNKPYYLDEFEPHYGKPLVIGRYKPFNRENKKRFWLPRQDQLQELYPRILKEDKLENLVDTICLWSECGGFFNDFVPETMEQLWLTLVMKERYSKVWDGEDWVKVE